MKIELVEKAADKKEKEDFFKKLLNIKEVYYNNNDNTLDAKERVQVVAMADKGSYGQWTFIEVKSPYALEVLPTAAITELAENGDLPAVTKTKGVEAEAEKQRVAKEAVVKNKKTK